MILPPQVAKRVGTLFAGKNPLRMHTTLDWFGGSRTELAITAFSGELAHTTIRSSGLTGTATCSRGMRSITFDFDVKTLSLSGGQLDARALPATVTASPPQPVSSRPQGYIAHEGTALVAHLRFDHGKLSLNGKAFPPSRTGPQP